MRELMGLRLTKEQADQIENEMRRLEADPSTDKHALRLFMQSQMPCGHAVGNLLTCPDPPFGCVICGEPDKPFVCTYQKDWPCEFSDPRLCAHNRMLTTNCPTFCDCRCHFEAHLDDTKRIVNSWPEWKRNILGRAVRGAS